jgi:2-haloacid dehalogenase
MPQINTIIFDLGGVLIDWNPKYLYRKIFRSEMAVDYFLNNITTPDWNEQQDGGRSLEEATKLLVDQYPEYTTEIEAFYGRWEEEMLGGAIEGTVDVLKSFIDNPDYKVYALTNWSAETFPFARKKFSFLKWFDGILVSGEENMKKPDPDIYDLIIDRFGIDRSRSIFIDDSLRNVNGAEKAGIQSIHFTDPIALKDRLISLNLYPAPG